MRHDGTLLFSGPKMRTVIFIGVTRNLAEETAEVNIFIMFSS